jgi:hypothetical protein
MAQRINKAQEKDSSKPKKAKEGQKAINEGQRDINGALCYVDWHVIRALRALAKALENAGVLTRAQLQDVYKEIKLAYDVSEKVADIDPPGCGPNFRIPKDDPSVIKAA